MSEHPVMTFPIKKRINIELFMDGGAELYIEKWGAHFLANLKRVKVCAKTNNSWD